MNDIVIPPLSDCRDLASHPVATLSFFGHGANVSTLEDGLSSGRFHHGWIFAGPSGIGKATLAYHLTRLLVSDEKFEKQESPFLLNCSRRIAGTRDGHLLGSFAHPNVKHLRRLYDEKAKRHKLFIGVDQMRELKTFLHSTPAMGRRRVVVIDRADDMNISATNALLKVLEEPPTDTYFILIATSIGAIAQTVRSRCRVLNFRVLDAEDFKLAVAAAVDRSGLIAGSEIEWDDLYRLSNGEVDRALALIEGRGIEFYRLLLDIVGGLPKLAPASLNKFTDGVLADKSGKDYQEALSLIDDLLVRLIKGCGAGLVLDKAEKTIQERLITRQSLDQWIALWDRVRARGIEVSELNLDKKSYLLQSIFEMRDLTR